ncbi:hypothetical protein ACFL1E_00310 [Candidatus Omnitrophota bacterium]
MEKESMLQEDSGQVNLPSPKSTGITIIGWMLIGYGLYMLSPIIWVTVVAIQTANTPGMTGGFGKVFSLSKDLQMDFLPTSLYCVFIFIQRLAIPTGALVSGAGILQLRNGARELGISLAWIVIITIFSFYVLVGLWEQNIAGQDFILSQLVVEIPTLFASAAAIIFLTRSSVRDQFYS